MTVKPYAVEVQVTTTVTVFPDATSPEEAAAKAKEDWAELTRFSGDDVPYAFDERTMTVGKVTDMSS